MQSKQRAPALRNRSIKQRDFRSRQGVNRSRNLSVSGMDSSVIIKRVSSEEDENDVSIVNLNDSVSDMASVGGQSMAGLSDASGGDVVKKVSSGVSDGGSMYSASDVQVVKQGGDVTYDDMNNSMAGLSDVSMSDVVKVNNNDSMADYSMASLNDDSMAGPGDDQILRMKSQSAVAEQSSSDITSDGSANMLDGLKKELGMPSVSNP